MKTVKFYGKFRDLIPDGFTFQKLYAKNYRCYYKKIKCDNIWIWQHHGGYIEINDYYSLSYLLFNAVLLNQNWQGQYGRFAIHLPTNTLHPFEARKHEAWMVCQHEDDNELKKLLDKHHATWRHDGLEKETIRAIKVMASKGWIKPTPV